MHKKYWFKIAQFRRDLKIESMHKGNQILRQWFWILLKKKIRKLLIKNYIDSGY